MVTATQPQPTTPPHSVLQARNSLFNRVSACIPIIGALFETRMEHKLQELTGEVNRTQARRDIWLSRSIRLGLTGLLLVITTAIGLVNAIALRSLARGFAIAIIALLRADLVIGLLHSADIAIWQHKKSNCPYSPAEYTRLGMIPDGPPPFGTTRP